MLGENPFASKELVGGRLCLDFTNTISQHDPEPVNDWLHGYGDLVWWGLRAAVLAESQGEALFEEARARPEEAARVFERAIVLREAAYRIFDAVRHGEAVAAEDLEVLNGELARAMPHLRVVAGEDGFGWAWEGEELDRMLWPVARSAAELLTTPEELARVGGCCGDNCDWLYLDTSRNRSRRWCDMKDCGNRAKARRHYHRVRGAEV